MPIQTIHERTLTKSTLLSQYWKEDMITPDGVIAVLNEAKVSFVLVGAYGLAGWLQEARATEDVDVIVAAKHHKKALQALLTAYSHLEALECDVVTRLCDRETKVVAVDVMRPAQQPMREVFKNATIVTVKGQQYRIPSLEMALTMKFAAMTSPTRREKDKYQDAHDFIGIVEANRGIATDKFTELADHVCGGGGRYILGLVRQARAGETLNL